MKIKSDLASTDPLDITRTNRFISSIVAVSVSPAVHACCLRGSAWHVACVATWNISHIFSRQNPHTLILKLRKSESVVGQSWKIRADKEAHGHWNSKKKKKKKETCSHKHIHTDRHMTLSITGRPLCFSYHGIAHPICFCGR